MTQPTRVFIVCPGLGRVVRGYETFARECFDALADDDRIHLYLFKGAGPQALREKIVWSLSRDQLVARLVGKLVHKNGYYIEQMTFLASLLPAILRFRPNVIFFSDVNLRTPLWHLRRLLRQSYRLLLSNGGPVGPPFPRCEHVHQVLPEAVEETRRAGHSLERQSFVPYGFDIPADFSLLAADDKRRLRVNLGLPLDRSIILSVGALNVTHKRMDYVIREVASLAEPRPFLLLLGAVGDETPKVIEIADRLLGPTGYTRATVLQAQMPDYYRAADSFVLASLTEGFGRAYVEALGYGLPCFAHDYPAARYILGTVGMFGDFHLTGSLAQLLRAAPTNTEADQQARHLAAYNRFSWSALRNSYIEMFTRCAVAPLVNKS